MRRALTACLVVAAIVCLGRSAAAGMFDPKAGWRTIETPHFLIHYPEHIRDVAAKAAEIMEEIHPKIAGKWDWRPWGKSDIVLTDSTDDANGLTSVIPYNWMLIYVAPPDPESSLGHYDHWLRELLLHEYTHLVQIDAYGGIWYPVRAIFGKTVAPSGINPTWMREAIAQYDETIFTTAGRGRGSYSEMVVRTALAEDAFPTIDVANGLSWHWPSYRAAYIYGIKFVSWLIATYGEDRFLAFDKRVRKSPLVAMVNHQARNIYGKTFYELWNEWRRSLDERYAAERAARAAAGTTVPAEIVVPVVRDSIQEGVTLSPDGKSLAYTSSSPHGKSEIRLLDLSTGETRVLRKGQVATQFSFSPDGQKLAYAAMGGYKTYYNYNDLYLLDLGAEGEPKLTRLTSGLRAHDPEFDRDGTSLIFIALDKGTDRLMRMNLETRETTVLTPDVPCFARFSNPRFSPDGRSVVASVWKAGDGWRIYRCHLDGKEPVRLTRGSGIVSETRPIFTPDGRAVIFSSDENGISNLYRVPAQGGQQVRLTNVESGVFQPQLASPTSVYAQYYTAKGFAIARFDLPALAQVKAKAKVKGKGKRKTRVVIPRPSAAPTAPPRDLDVAPSSAAPSVAMTSATVIKVGLPVKRSARAKFTGRPEPRESGAEAPAAGEPTAEAQVEAKAEAKAETKVETEAETEAQVEVPGAGAMSPPVTDTQYTDRKYVAFGKALFLPRFLLPNAAYVNQTIFLSLTTGGSDLLRWHNWLATGTYRQDARFFGYFIRYWYNRYRPVIGATAADYAVDFGNVSFGHRQDPNDPNSPVVIDRTVHYFERRKAASFFLSVPMENHLMTLSYFYEDHSPKTALTPDEAARLNLGAFAGLRAEYRYGDSELYPASISRENGRDIRLHWSITNHIFGARDGNEQVIFAGDWREFIRLCRHHVLAVRAAGGITWGDTTAQGTFGMGGAIGEGAFSSGGSYNYFPLRGLPISALSRSRAMLFSTEYRFPIIEPQRGIGTIPFFLKDISGALFADYGNAWNAGEGGSDSFRHFFDDFLLGVGAELRANAILGTGLLIHGRVGYAIIVVNRDRAALYTDPIVGNNARYGMLVLSLGTAF